ncbi:MAG: class I SAM-dependent methyltransferase [Pseudomonadota bacterium]
MTESTIAVELGPAQTTLLIPLLGRAEETRKRNGMINDPLAVKVVEELDFDFSRWAKAKSLAAAVFRTRMYDQMVAEFLQAHPSGTVVEIGCGLNTRFDRLDNGQVQWFDLDLPDVMALRRRYVQDQPRCTMLTASVVDTDWHDEVLSTGGPWCFISEAVIIYLDNELAEQSIEQIAKAFPGAWIITDTTSTAMVHTQGQHDAMKHLPEECWFQWACDEPKQLESLGLTLVESNTFMDADPELIAQLPLTMRWMIRVFPNWMRSRVEGYRINRLVARSANA